MSALVVSVSLPVRFGGERLGEVLDDVRGQRLERELVLVVVDSGSTDGSVALALSDGAELFVIVSWRSTVRPSELNRPPPLVVAELPLIVLATMVVVCVVRFVSLQTPPPVGAELPLIVLSVTVTLP